MKAVVIPIDGSFEEIESTYENIREAIGGYLEIAPTPGSPFVMLCNEHGKLDGLPFNFIANQLANRYRDWEDPLMGNVVLVGLPDREGENTEYSLEDLYKLVR
jgi:hypothetical protein